MFTVDVNIWRKVSQRREMGQGREEVAIFPS